MRNRLPPPLLCPRGPRPQGGQAPPLSTRASCRPAPCFSSPSRRDTGGPPLVSALRRATGDTPAPVSCGERRGRRRERAGRTRSSPARAPAAAPPSRHRPRARDRKSVVWGNSEYVRVDLGGGRIYKQYTI